MYLRVSSSRYGNDAESFGDLTYLDGFSTNISSQHSLGVILEIVRKHLATKDRSYIYVLLHETSGYSLLPHYIYIDSSLTFSQP